MTGTFVAKDKENEARYLARAASLNDTEKKAFS